MRLKSLLFVCYALVFSMFLSHRAMADFDGIIDIDEDSALNSEKPESKKLVDSSDGEGDDEDDYGSVMSDESGSATSGDESTTDPSIVDVSVVSPTTKEIATTEAKTTTDIDNYITDSKEKASEEPENSSTKEPDNMFGGGVGFPTEESTEKSPNAEARVDEKVLRVLTTEVIAAVVVGAVCAVILIAFLVYRLRKRDEGSYALSDAGYKDTYKLQGDTGKEAFV